MKIDVAIAVVAGDVLRERGMCLCDSDREMLSNILKDYMFEVEISESLYKQRYGELQALSRALLDESADDTSESDTTAVVDVDKEAE